MHPAIGPLLAIASTFCFAVMAIAAKVSYADGASAGFVMTARVIAGVIGIGAVLLVLRGRLSFAHSGYRPLAGYVVGLTGISLGYMGAIAHIPASFAALIFYLFPIFTQIALSIRARQWPTPLVGFATVVAFVGLYLILGADTGQLAWQGILLALLAAAGATILFLSSPGLIAATDPITAVFSGSVLVLPLVAGLSGPVFGGFEVPTSTPAIAILCLGLVLYASGLIFQIQSIRHANVGRVAVLFNMEPVLVVLMATTFFGETLTTQQWIGATVVVAAILMIALQRDDPSPKPE